LFAPLREQMQSTRHNYQIYHDQIEEAANAEREAGQELLEAEVWKG